VDILGGKLFDFRNWSKCGRKWFKGILKTNFKI
jgi:hypothetical protein